MNDIRHSERIRSTLLSLSGLYLDGILTVACHYLFQYGMLTLELSSNVLEIFNDSYTALSQNLNWLFNT